MKVTQSIKRAPKWAWYIVGGVAIGAAGIRVWKGRATDTTDTTDTTQTDTQGAPQGTAQPSPVIVPPVITQGDTGDNGALADMTGTFAGTIGSSFDNMVNVISGLTAGDQAIASQATGSLEEISKTLLANGGSAPKPVTQVGPVQTVTKTVAKPTPRATPHTVTLPAEAKCPAPFPRHNAAKGKPSAKSCYRCQQNAGKNRKQYPWIHHYQNAATVYSKTC
jgi:hypothetical protein